MFYGIVHAISESNLNISSSYNRNISNWYASLSAAEELVALQVFDTTYYGLDKEGDYDWARLFPRGRHTVRLHDDTGITMQHDDYDQAESEYSVTLFHELKCLELYRIEYIKHPGPSNSPLIAHCLNYLRQQVLCHINIKLESVKNAKAQSGRQYTTVCRDWTKVYDAMERNLME
ncbi:hypothetical protein BDQ17DRAFT_1306533 [Cyathus striatus]|nr:hypothetical protein BDQ17DRAFT_1306533 [Cyathus striatus]